MSNETVVRTGQVTATPEGGPIDEGVPASAPGAGHVQITPEAGPLIPPTMHDHMQGPILGLDDRPATPSPPAPPSPPAAGREEPSMPPFAGADRAAEAAPLISTRTKEDDEELRKWPPYSGKPVSEVHWDALRYAAPLVSQAEKLAIQAIDLSGRGLTRLAHFLEERRKERADAAREDDGDTR